MGLGDRITERMTALRITQGELARRIGISQPSVNYLIRKGAGGSAHLHKIARELQTSPEYLTGETDDPDSDGAPEMLSSQEREWVDLLSRLDAKDRAAVVHIARSMAHSFRRPENESEHP